MAQAAGLPVPFPLFSSSDLDLEHEDGPLERILPWVHSGMMSSAQPHFVPSQSTASPAALASLQQQQAHQQQQQQLQQQLQRQLHHERSHSSLHDDYEFLASSSSIAAAAAAAATFPQPKQTIEQLGLDPPNMLPMSNPYGVFLDTHSLRSSVSVPNLGLSLNMQPMGIPPPMPTIPLAALQQLQSGSSGTGADCPGGPSSIHHVKELSGSSAASSMPALTHSSDSSSSAGGIAGPSSEALVRNASSQSAQSDYSMTNKLAANRALSVEGFPSRTAFRSVHMAYLTKISFRRDKSLVTPAMYDAVAWYLLCRADGREEAIRQLGLEEDTSKGEREREAFKRWCIRTFRLGPGIMPHNAGLTGQLDKQTVLERSALVATTCPGGYSIISIADGKPVAPPAQLYGVLVFCHKRTGHGGRDKTHAFLRKYFANVPKELVQAFIKMCPTCNFKRNRDAPFQDSFDGDVEASSESAPPSSPPPSAPLVLQSAEQWQINNQSIAPGLHFHHPAAAHYHAHANPFHYKAPGTLTSPPSLAELQAGTLTSPPSLSELQIGTLTSPPSLSELSERGGSAGGPGSGFQSFGGGLSAGVVGSGVPDGSTFASSMLSAQAQSTYIAPDFNLSTLTAGLGGGGGGAGGLDASSAESGSGLLTPSQFSFLRSPNMPFSGGGGGGGVAGSVFGSHGAPADSLQQRLTALALGTAQNLPTSSSSPHAMPSTATSGDAARASVDWGSIMAQFDNEYGPASGSAASVAGTHASASASAAGSMGRSSFWREGSAPPMDLLMGGGGGGGVGGGDESGRTGHDAEVDADATISA
ncbi:hypothetical protein OC842_004783 [Tilletia horrida]|uniref:Integrase zinc-binding domain-containing protein n=1 Tax=Tilletia horrida TaxID=155126 RepID=A0AAN6G931_9BASI|nr:hypothetical protein OC842_004783 [Tilletia horrida]